MKKETFDKVTEKLSLTSVRKACFIANAYLTDREYGYITEEEFYKAVEVLMAYSYTNSNDETEISVSDYSIDNLDPESFENFLDGFVSYFASSSFFVGDEDFSVEVEEDSNANSNQEESSNQNRKKFDDSPVAKSLRKTFPHMSEKFNQEYHQGNATG